MARFYTNTSPLSNIVEGFSEGQKLNRDELYRRAQQQLAAQESALLKMGGYMKPSAAQGGYVSGFEENKDNIQRDQGPMEANVPQFFKKVLNEAKPEIPAVVNDVSPSGVPIKTYPDEPQRTPQSGPLPLLKSKDSVKLDPLAAQADKLIYNEEDKKLIGQKPDGTLQYAAPAVKTELSGLPGVELTGSPSVPAVPEESQNFNPSPMMRAKIQEMMTAQTAKDTDPIIQYNSFTPEQRKKLGIPEDAQGGQRASILKELIQGSYKTPPKGSEAIAPDIIEAVKKIESGISVGQVGDELYSSRGGAGFTPREMSVLQAAESRRIAKENANRNFNLASNKFETEKKKLSPKNEDRIINLDTLRNTLEQAQELVSSGKVKPRAEIDIARRMGAFSGVPLEAVNSALELGGRKPLTDDEAQFLKLTSNANLSKLVEVAGTTFTARFGSMIQDLGSDIANPKRFNQNTQQMLAEIDRQKNNIINVGQANKSGNISSQRPSETKDEDRGPKPQKWNESMLRAERKKAQDAIDAVKAKKFPDADKRIQGIKGVFKENTGVDF